SVRLGSASRIVGAFGSRWQSVSEAALVPGRKVRSVRACGARRFLDALRRRRGTAAFKPRRQAEPESVVRHAGWQVAGIYLGKQPDRSRATVGGKRTVEVGNAGPHDRQ